MWQRFLPVLTTRSVNYSNLLKENSCSWKLFAALGRYLFLQTKWRIMLDTNAIINESCSWAKALKKRCSLGFRMHEAHLAPLHGVSIVVYCPSIHRNNQVNSVMVHNELILYLLKWPLQPKFPWFLPSLPRTLRVNMIVSEIAVCYSILSFLKSFNYLLLSFEFVVS